MKRLLIVIAIVLGLTLAGILYLFLSGKSSVKKKLSDRAKEFIATRQKAHVEFYDNLSLDKNKQTAPTTVNVNVRDCFSLTVPFFINDTKDDGVCQRRFLITNPHGMIALYKRLYEIQDYDEESGIHMRRAFPDKYQESSIVVNGRKFLIFRNRDPQIYEKSAFYLQNGVFLGLSINIEGNPNLDLQFLKMLQSLRFDLVVPVTPTIAPSPLPASTAPSSTASPSAVPQ